ncbi:hypothetical protein [Ornithinibacillus bavariensis]|nr:hypothetical protein [Ornithinibacillus bavariensis]
MRNRIKVVKLLFEIVITLIPFTITYLLLGNWLSGVNDFGRAYEEPWNPNIHYGWIEFDTFGEGFANYSFDVVQVFWIVLVLAIFLILLGKLIHVGLVKLIENRVKLKK